MNTLTKDLALRVNYAIKLFFATGIVLFSMLNSTSAQLSNVIVEEEPLSGMIGLENFDGYTNYRIFAQTENPTDQVDRVIGSADCPLDITSDIPFFISGPMAASEPKGESINPFIFGFLPDVKYSSVVTIGTGATGLLGVLAADDTDGSLSNYYGATDGLLGGVTGLIGVNLLAAPGEEWWTDFGTTGASIDISTADGGGWFSIEGTNTLGVGVNNSVMLGSFTTPGSFSYNINVGTQEEAGTIDYSHCNSDIPGLTFNSNNCTSAEACNYNPDAEEDDGSCYFIGENCNDFNEETVNDIYTDECTCFGELMGCMSVVACNFEPLAIIDNGECIFPGDECNDLNDQTINDIYSTDCNCEGELLGCTNVIACNYNVNAVIDDGSCGFPNDSCNDDSSLTANDTYSDECNCIGQLLGCTNVIACNFNPEAEVEDGTCLITGESCEGETGVVDENCNCYFNLEGFVIIDDNYNGFFDELLFLPFQTVTLQPGGIQVITDNFGHFNFGTLAPGQYEVTVDYTAGWSEFTTPVTATVTLPLTEPDPIIFGVTNSETPAPSGCVDFYTWGAGVPCNSALNYNICYRNLSPYAINGVIEIELDDLLEYNFSVPAAENVDGQVISWSFENQSSGEMFFDDIFVYTPSEEHIGESMTSYARMYAEVEGELVLVFEEVITQEVNCAFDPNDIRGIPAGYTDDHLVLPDTRMEYLIRFQNTGNAPAETVLVVDTLDEDMDFDTFQLVANSHNVLTTIEESGRVEFLFPNINLPDSVADEPGSHGLVSFKIDFKEDIEISEEVNQTAYIYFDNNPPVITNTTWHTIHECGGEAVFDLSSISACEGDEVTMTSTNPLVEDYQWNIESTEVSTTEQYSQVFSEEGEYVIQFVADNPLCSESSMQVLNVFGFPDFDLTQDGSTLTASEGELYQWYLNGEVISGATSQNYEAIEDGLYSVEVTNENNCTTISEETMIVSVSELRGENIKLYPNPMLFSSTLELGATKPNKVTLLDTRGRALREWVDIEQESVEITRDILTAGTYVIRLDYGHWQKNISLVIK